jgi:hypothetical protein
MLAGIAREYRLKKKLKKKLEKRRELLPKIFTWLGKN